MIDHVAPPELTPADDAHHIFELLRSRGERLTTPRRAIIELLAGTREHFTVEDLAQRLHDAHPSIAPSTLYRTLEALEQWGLVERVHRNQGPTFFHLTRSHQHLVCEVCGKVSDVPSHELAPLVSRLRDHYGFDLHAHHVALPGACASHAH